MPLIPNRENLITFLQSCELFQGIAGSALDTLLDDFEPVYLEGQKTLMRQGEVGDEMFLVVYGRLRAFENADTKNEKVLSEVGAGDVVGEIALLLDKPRTAYFEFIDWATTCMPWNVTHSQRK